jgi:hypothetical protein
MVGGVVKTVDNVTCDQNVRDATPSLRIARRNLFAKRTRAAATDEDEIAISRCTRDAALPAPHFLGRPGRIHFFARFQHRSRRARGSARVLEQALLQGDATSSPHSSSGQTFVPVVHEEPR